MSDRFSQVKTDVLQTLFNTDIELKNTIIPDTDAVYDIGTPSKRIGTIYAATTVGTLTNPNIAVDTIRMPSTIPNDIRIQRTGTRQLNIDDNNGGVDPVNMVLSGNLTATAINAGSIAATSLRTVNIVPGVPNPGDALIATSSSSAQWSPIGDVDGPATATNNAAVRFDGTTGKLIKNSTVTIADNGNITTAGTLTAQTISAPNNPATSLRTVAIGLTPPVGGQVLKAIDANNAVWAADNAGTGDVVGPATSVDNRITRFDGTTGKLIQESSVTLDDTGNLTGIGNINGRGVDDFVIGAGTSVVNRVAVYDDATGKRIKSSNVVINGNDISSVGTLQGSLVRTSFIESPISANIQLIPATGIVNFTNTNIEACNSIQSNTDLTVTATNNIILDPGNIINCTGADVTAVNNLAATSVTTNDINTTVGDLSLNPAGNIGCNNKDVNGVQTLRANISVITNNISSTNNTMSINPLIAANFNNKDITGVRTLAVGGANNTSGTVLQLGSSVNSVVATDTPICIDSGSSAANSLGGISFGDQKWRLYSRSNGDYMGVSMNNSGAYISSFGGPSSAAYFWAWVASGNTRMILTNPGILQVPNSIQTPSLTTASGDLSINPAGSNINFNNKNIINAANIATTLESGTINFTASGWTGNTTLIAHRSGKIVTLRFTGSALPNDGTTTVFNSSLSLPASYRPTILATQVCLSPGPILIGVDVFPNGSLSIGRIDGAAFSQVTGIGWSGSSNSCVTYAVA